MSGHLLRIYRPIVSVKRLIQSSNLILLAHSHRRCVLSRVVKVTDDENDNGEKGHRDDEDAALGDYTHCKNRSSALYRVGGFEELM